MARDSNDFSPEIVRTLYNRAGQRCSHCKRPTSGGNTDDTKATIIGEAAHIKGAQPNSRRYDASMTPEERSHPSNGIWLCSNCHTEVDRDPAKYPAELLQKWKRDHESSVLQIEPVNPWIVNSGVVTTAQVSGDNNQTNVTNVYNNIYMGTISQNYPDQIAEQVKYIVATPPNHNTNDPNLIITLSPFMGVVKSPELPGTRIQIEFTILNTQNETKIIKGVYVKLGDGEVNFKKFFKINENSSREPDYTKRFPIVINSKGADKLAIEFENLDIPLIHKGDIEGELVVLTGEEKLAKKDFIFEVNEAMVNTLDALQQNAAENQMPIVFDAMIKS
ncbi:MAG: hypothetical protein G01um10147_950 [Microgenomates group bacterium Gr01-1014_7]|nr:MAG: hypothetical protein G01um10147_950 [Microgenomates group bacterium Gr01-1014_7]